METINKQKILIFILIFLNTCFCVFLILCYMECFHEHSETIIQNKTTLEMYTIYKNIDSTGYIKCSSFEDFYLNNSNCGKTMCYCIKNIVGVFENHCIKYTKNIVDSFSECHLVAETIKGCMIFFCKI